MVYLGDISYATYMFHFLVYDLFKFLFVDDLFRAPLWSVSLSIALCLPLSMAVYHWFERPSQRWVMLMAGRRRAI